jgi:hypothetical protein
MDIINEKTVEMTFDEFCRGGKSITPGPWHFVIEDDERKIAAPPKSKDYKREILMCDAAYYPHCPAAILLPDTRSMGLWAGRPSPEPSKQN